MIGILRSYVLREILVPTLMAALSLTFIILVMAPAPWDSSQRLLFTLIRFFFRADAERGQILAILGSALPGVILFVTPMALLVGIIIGIGRMTMDLEIRAMQSGGVHLMQIFLPILLTAAALSAAIGAVSHTLQPRLMLDAMQRGGQLLVGEVTRLEPGRVYSSLFKKGSGMSLYYDRQDPDTGSMRGVTLLIESKALDTAEQAKADKEKREARENRLKEKLAEGRLTKQQYDEERSRIEHGRDKGESPMMVLAGQASFSLNEEATGVRLDLGQGSVHMLDTRNTPPAAPDPKSADAATTPTDDREYAILRFDKLTKTEPLGVSDEIKKADLRTVGELKELMRDESRSKKRRNQARAAILERYSFAFQSLILALVGLPLAIYIRPTGKSISILLAAGLILTYHLLIRSGSSMVESGKSLGVFMVFMPNLLFAAASVFLWRQALRK